MQTHQCQDMGGAAGEIPSPYVERSLVKPVWESWTSKGQRIILEEVKQWVRELEQLYTNPGQMGACVRLTGNGCTGHIYPMNASNMTMDIFKVNFDELPIIKLTVIDLPEEWTMIQLQGTMAFMVSFCVKSKNQQFATVILCGVE